MKIFVDTGAFYALADKSDKNHLQAVKLYSPRVKKDFFVTSHYVLVETWFLLQSKLSYSVAQNFWRSLRRGIAQLVTIEPSDLDQAWKISQKFSDLEFSLVDCTSFALMEKLDINVVFTFDRHFSVYRYGRDLKKFFTILG